MQYSFFNESFSICFLNFLSPPKCSICLKCCSPSYSIKQDKFPSLSTIAKSKWFDTNQIIEKILLCEVNTIDSNQLRLFLLSKTYSVDTYSLYKRHMAQPPIPLHKLWIILTFFLAVLYSPITEYSSPTKIPDSFGKFFCCFIHFPNTSWAPSTVRFKRVWRYFIYVSTQFMYTSYTNWGFFIWLNKLVLSICFFFYIFVPKSPL